MAPPIVLIVAGVIVFIVAFLGCYGAIKEHYNMLIAVRICLYNITMQFFIFYTSIYLRIFLYNLWSLMTLCVYKCIHKIKLSYSLNELFALFVDKLWLIVRPWSYLLFPVRSCALDHFRDRTRGWNCSGSLQKWFQYGDEGYVEGIDEELYWRRQVCLG